MLYEVFSRFCFVCACFPQEVIENRKKKPVFFCLIVCLFLFSLGWWGRVLCMVFFTFTFVF